MARILEGVSAGGFGAFAGILTLIAYALGFVGELLAEATEETERKPGEAMEATGARKAKVIAYAIVPLVMQIFFAVSILRRDVDMRASTVLGLVGAAGIGPRSQGATDTFERQEASTLLIAILRGVVAGECISGRLRRKEI